VTAIDFAPTDELLERMRAKYGAGVPDAPDFEGLTADCYRSIDETERYIEELRADALRTEAARAFRTEYPALARWRDRILKHPRRYNKAEVAAAYELMALECALGGLGSLAARARIEARRAVGLSARSTLSPTSEAVA
jgi:hypothetical protein